MDTLLLIPFISSPDVVLDGVLSEGIYEQALVLDTLNPVYPHDAVEYPFRLYLFHDGQNLYIGGFIVNPHGIHAQKTSRDP